MAVTIIQIDTYLKSIFNNYLIKDAGINGIQVDNQKELSTLGFAVDATSKTIDLALANKVDFLFVHHGLFWGFEEPILGPLHHKLSTLLNHRIGLYAIHLPLDIHAVLGNNIVIANTLQLQDTQQNIFYQDVPLGYSGFIKKEDLLYQLTKHFPHTFLPFYHKMISDISKKILSVGISSGSFSVDLFHHNYTKVDLFLTGEVNLATYNKALDFGIPIIPLGHYFTEKFGIFALMKHLKEKYPQLVYKFIDNEKLI